VIMEAAAMRVPIVASDIPGCREIVRHRDTALLFSAGDADALAAALRTALHHKPDALKRARRAEAEVRRRFDRTASAARTLEAHASVLEEATQFHSW
jgi:glycosyltransferase involved in cell wall biosynthesis